MGYCGQGDDDYGDSTETNDQFQARARAQIKADVATLAAELPEGWSVRINTPDTLGAAGTVTLTSPSGEEWGNAGVFRAYDYVGTGAESYWQRERFAPVVRHPWRPVPVDLWKRYWATPGYKWLRATRTKAEEGIHYRDPRVKVFQAAEEAVKNAYVAAGHPEDFGIAAAAGAWDAVMAAAPPVLPPPPGVWDPRRDRPRRR